MFDLIVMRVAVNKLGPIGGEHVSRALMRRPWMQPPSGGLRDLVPRIGRTC